MNHCKTYYKQLCTIFKNILCNGNANNRQLAKLSVSLTILLGNYVHPQLILNELIDNDLFDSYTFRIQLEMLAIVTATLLKYRHHKYDQLFLICKRFIPLLVTNRRELRHGTI
ncbi:unnamed protein product, partial [Didymodactylos carnosus]